MSDPFNTRLHVSDFDAIVADYRAASAQTRKRHGAQIDVAYGAHPDERLDLFFPPDMGERAPIHMFIHGGYWRANRKEDYAFVAEPILAAGAIAAIVDYALMPGVRMGEIVAQVRRAAAFLSDHGRRFGGDGTRLSASGHSAGAQLCFYLVAKGPGESAWPTNAVGEVLLVSGLYDLAPLRHSFLQAEIGLTEAEVADWSPLGADVRAGVRLNALVGSGETPPFHAQAAALAARFGAHVTTLPGLDHMSIVRELGRPDTPAAQAVVETARGRMS